MSDNSAGSYTDDFEAESKSDRSGSMNSKSDTLHSSFKKSGMCKITSPSLSLRSLNVTNILSDSDNSDKSLELPDNDNEDINTLKSSNSLDHLSLKPSYRHSSSAENRTNHQKKVYYSQRRSEGSKKLDVLTPFREYKDMFFRAGIDIFNRNYKKGIVYFLIFEFMEPKIEGIAQFLRNTNYLSKELVGELLGDVSDEYCVQILDSFSSSFDFNGVPVDVALRNFQAIFRMPGEAQKIQRILESFADSFVSSNLNEQNLEESGLLNSDAILVLTYAMMMLNTDLHNMSVRDKMSKEEFIKNIRGAEFCKTLPEEYLSSIYDNIKAEEFELLADHSQQLKQTASLIGGKNKPDLFKSHRFFISVYTVNEIKTSKRSGSSQKCLFIFNDCLIITKLATRNHRNKTVPKQYYIYRKTINMDEILPYRTVKDNVYYVALYTINKEIVELFDCIDLKEQEKLYRDLEKFTKQAYLTKMMLQLITKTHFKTMMELLQDPDFQIKAKQLKVQLMKNVKFFSMEKRS